MSNQGLSRQAYALFEDAVKHNDKPAMETWRQRAANDFKSYKAKVAGGTKLTPTEKRKYDTILKAFPEFERLPPEGAETPGPQAGALRRAGRVIGNLLGFRGNQGNQQQGQGNDADSDPFEGTETRAPTPDDEPQDLYGDSDVGQDEEKQEPADPYITPDHPPPVHSPPPLHQARAHLQPNGGNVPDFNPQENNQMGDPATDSSTDTDTDNGRMVANRPYYNYLAKTLDNLDNLNQVYGSIPQDYKAKYDAVRPTAVRRKATAQRKWYAPDGIGKTTTRRQYNATADYDRAGYTDTMKEFAKTLGLTNAQDLSGVLPKHYLNKDIKNVYKQDTLFYNKDAEPDRPDGPEPNEEDLAYVEMLKLGGRPYNDAVIGRTRRNMAGNRPALSEAEKRTARNEAMKLRLNARSKWQDHLPDGELGKALTAQQKVREWNRYYRHQRQLDKEYYDPDEKVWKKKDDAYLRRTTALRNIKHKLPASISRPEYLGWLGDPNIEGVPYDSNTLDKVITEVNKGGYGDLIKRNVDAEDLEGYTWQTMDAATRNKYMARFAEMIGVLNAHPVFDERLVAVESAKYVYSPKDFNIDMINFDRNMLTPAVCVVSTKKSMKVNGVRLPAGSIVSVGGWSLANGTEGYSTKQLKDIMYYNSNPTKNMRRANPRNLWLNQLFGDPATRRDNTKNLKFIVDHLRAVIEAKGYILPHLYQEADASKSLTVPAFMKLSALRPDPADQTKQVPTVIAYFSLSAPVFRTYLSRVAELFFNVYIAPLAAGTLPESTPTLAALKRVIQGYGNTYLLEVDADGKITPRDNPAGDNAVEYEDARYDLSPLVNRDPNEFAASCRGYWMDTYYHSDFIGALFRDNVFKQWYPKNVQMIFDKAGAGHYPDGVRDMMHTIMFFAMNSELPALVDSVDFINHAVIDETNPEDYNSYISTFRPNLEFCKQADLQNIFNNPHKVINVTNKNWRNDVIPRYQVTQRGYSYVVAGIDMEKFNKLAWADQKYYAKAPPAAQPKQTAALPPPPPPPNNRRAGGTGPQ